MVEQIHNIKLDDIIPSKWNRTIGGFDEEELQNLAASIIELGVQQPIIVRKIQNNGHFELVAGERRWRASRIAGKGTVPALIRDLSDLQVLQVQTIENLQRVNIHPLDEAAGYKRLVDKAEYDIDRIARELGKSASYVYQRLKLLELCEPARKLFIDKKITASHAILIARLPEDKQEKLIQDNYLNRNERWCASISVRDINDWIHSHVFLDLSKISWKYDDPDLLISAETCTECKKRTGYQDVLFADVCKNEKKDYCLDSRCYFAKTQAVIDRQKLKLANIPYIQVSHRLSYDLNDPGDKDLVPRFQWKECKKKDEGALRALIVDGDGAGKLIYATRTQSYSTSFTNDKEKKKEEKRKLNAACRMRKVVFDEIINQVKDKNFYDLPIDFIRIMVNAFWSRTMNDFRRIITKQEQWVVEKNQYGIHNYEKTGKKKIDEMSIQELLLFMIKLTLISEIHISPYESFGMSDLYKTIAGILNIDIKAVSRTVRSDADGKQVNKKTSKKHMNDN